MWPNYINEPAKLGSPPIWGAGKEAVTSRHLSDGEPFDDPLVLRHLSDGEPFDDPLVLLLGVGQGDAGVDLEGLTALVAE